MPKKSSSEKNAGTTRNDDIKRYMGILQEDFSSKFDLVIEQFSGINEKLDSHTEILDSHTEILDSHTKILDSHTRILGEHTIILDEHSKMFEGVNRKLDSHTDMIGKIAEDVEIIKTDIEFLKGGMKKKVDYDEFMALEKRISLLESKSKR